ncbi:hypothetical protein [Acidaminococcus timonensis]|uniref:hypothetical protein n=1 Tax=Acidaminococcus timonensis TaxID=1871002 RepID=UPI00307FA470
MKIRYIVDDDFLDAVDDLTDAAQKILAVLPSAQIVSLATALSDLQRKHRIVQDQMDDGFDTTTSEGADENENS